MLGPMDHDAQSAAAQDGEEPRSALVGQIECHVAAVESPLEVTVRSLEDDQAHAFHFMLDTTLRAIYDVVSYHKGIPATSFYLTCSGRLLRDERASLRKLRIMGEGGSGGVLILELHKVESLSLGADVDKSSPSNAGRLLTATNREATAGKRPVSYPSAEIVGDGPGSASMSPLRTIATADDAAVFETFQCHSSSVSIRNGPESASMSPLRTTAAADIAFLETLQVTDGVRGDVLTQCGICFADLAGSDKILPCAHDFCISCLQNLAALLVKEGLVEGLTCPDVGCRKDISVEVLRFLLSEDAFDRWERISTSRALEALEDIAYCPKCGSLCEGGEDYKMACYKCSHNFCLHCRNKWHGVSPCDEAGPSETSRKRPAVGMKKFASYERRENERLDLEYVKRQAKQCPKCRIGIEKVDGCNRIQCRNCGTYFCYVCTAQVTGYTHFNNRCGLHEPTPRMPARPAFLNNHLPPHPWLPPRHRRRAFWEGCRRALCCCFQ